MAGSSIGGPGPLSLSCRSFQRLGDVRGGLGVTGEDEQGLLNEQVNDMKTVVLGSASSRKGRINPPARTGKGTPMEPCRSSLTQLSRVFCYDQLPNEVFDL